jgi:hypothetical protein
MSLTDAIQAQAVTPYRESEIRFRVPEYLITRDGWSKSVWGADVAPGPDAAAGHSQQVVLLPSGHWQAESDQMRQRFDIAGSSAVSMWLPSSGSLLTPTDFQEFQAFGQIPGVTYDPSVASPGNTFVRKQVPASAADWSANLSTDQTAFPEPDYGTSDVTIDRVAKTIAEVGGKLGSNCPAYLRFIGPPAPLHGYGAFLTWFFGGPVALTAWPTGAVGPQGGEFALSLYGDGSAILYERTIGTSGDPTTPDPSQPWRTLRKFQWCPAGEIARGHHMLMAVPEQSNMLNILTGLGRMQGGIDWSRGFCFTCSKNVCGYEGKDQMTGAGVVRLSMRQDLRCPFQLGWFTYDAIEDHNVLVGHPSTVPFALPENTNIRLVTPATVPTASSITATLWDPSGPTALTAGAPSGDTRITNWLAPSGDKQVFNPRFTFGVGGTLDAGAVGSFSPSLVGYSLDVDVVQELSDDEPFTGDTYLGGGTMEWNVAGQDTEPASASCHILIDDVHDFLTTDPDVNPDGGLDVHTDLHFTIATKYDPDDTTAKLIVFDGILQPGTEATFHPTLSFPRRNLYNCVGAGQWARLAEPNQVVRVQKYLVADSTGTGEKITDILIGFLHSAGYPDEQIGIADSPIRFRANPANLEDFARVSPGVRLCDLADYFAKRYLRASLHWEANAGVNQRGMWVLLYPPLFRPDGLYDFRWHFTALPPDASPGVIKAVHTPGSYPDKHTFIETFGKRVEKPEANWIQVIACPAEAILGSGRGALQVPKGIVSKVIFNPRAYQEEGYPLPARNTLDWVGRRKRAYYPDLLLDTDNQGAETRQNCEELARILLEATGYGRAWKYLEGPFWPVWDASDDNLYGRPRCLRTGDLITVTQEDGAARPCVVHCAHPRSTNRDGGDLAQRQEVECFEIPIPIGY